MARTLTNFLVAIGMDLKEFRTGQRDLESGLKSTASMITQMGNATTTAVAAIGGAAITTANRLDKLNTSMVNMRDGAQMANNFGAALERAGGNASDAVSEIVRINQVLTDFKAKGQVPEGMQFTGMSGGQISDLLNAPDANTFLKKLAEQYQSMNTEQRQLTLQTLGLSNATGRLLEGGAQHFKDALSYSQQLTGDINDATAASREFMATWATTSQLIGGIGNKLAAGVLPMMSDALRFINREVMPTAKENPVAAATAATGGGLLGLGGALRFLPGGAAATGAAVANPVGLSLLAAGGGYMLGEYTRPAVEKSGIFPEWFTKEQPYFGIPAAWNYLTGGGGDYKGGAIAPPAYMTGYNAPTMSPYNTAAGAGGATARQLADELRRAPLNVKADVRVELDGRAFDRRVEQVTTRQNEQAINNMTSGVTR
ncbi:putative tail-fiber/lysozyme protein [Edwardsiella phage MSW-3]|uniref:Putative tail-fiber/lysozyme protein n=1 Tax=Edwardsiella phage MSW-3 TaxID=1264700 RepID=L0MYG9_9CAUD|nr:tail fiber protein/ lysozyme [Edwardsiella phage MSW-3]BAM68856.1 putative tail-fiber/lysozyme protein [Edwardsiella phage MSW-3]